MSTSPDRSRENLLKYVEANQTPGVQQYARALFTEEDELRAEIASIQRVGYTPKGRLIVLAAVGVGILLIVICAIFFWGYHLGAAR